MLHLIFQPLSDSVVLDRMACGDAAVFLESGVLSLMRQGCMAGVLRAKLADHRFFALEEDLALRGILVEELAEGIAVIDYAGWVQLTVQHPLIQSWA